MSGRKLRSLLVSVIKPKSI